MGQGVRGKGQDRIESKKIKEHLTTEFVGSEIYIFDRVESTNDTAKELAHKGCKEGMVVIADSQSKGRGRLGRRWESPPGVGVYLSILMRPKDASLQLTIVAGVAAVEAIRKISNFQFPISNSKNMEHHILLKWPNDIIINGKKGGGILTESIANGKAVIVGMGINVNTPPSSPPLQGGGWGGDGFSDELKSKATSIMIETGIRVDRNILISELLNKFEYWYKRFAGGDEAIVTERFRELSRCY